MAITPKQTQSIIVDEERQDQSKKDRVDPKSQLVSWVMSRVNRWRQYRDRSFKDRWDEYYRIFRGRWHVKDKNRSSERSRLISPALMSALEQTVAEMEEATFGRDQWFDVQDDDQDNQDALANRDQLMTDLRRQEVNAEDAVSESYLNGALYGELIMKIVPEPYAERTLARNGITGALEIRQNDRALIRWEPLESNEFVPDPSGRTIEEMLGCAHEVLRPKSWVEEQMAKGAFDRVPLMPWTGGTDPEGGDKQAARADDEDHITNEDAVMITEYHGRVPSHMLPPRGNRTEQERQLDELIDEQALMSDGVQMVEAIVTIANKGVLLKARRNPFIMQDRAFVACQFEKVPGRFWGRGVMEKGYNPQKALDAELRARIDALGLISNPMMGADARFLPRGFDLRVRPGKVWLTQGAPKDVLQPVQFQGLEPATFNQSNELERMVNTATGALDLAQMVRSGQSQAGGGRPNATTSSILQGAFIKRSKRAMQNVSRKFLQPLIQKTVWRYMQLEPTLYQQDYQFRPVATMGIMAREFEQTQLTQLMGQVPDEMAAPKLLLLQGIIENSSSSIKKELQASIRQEIKNLTGPEAQQARQIQQAMQQRMAELELEEKAMQNALTEAQIEKTLAEGFAALMEASLEDDKLSIEAIRTAIEERKTQLLEEQNEIARMKARSESSSDD